MKKPILIASMTLASLGIASAADWERLDVPPSVKSPAGVATILLDTSSIVRDGNTATVWFRLYWGNDTGQTKQYNSTFDCRRRVSNLNDAFYVDADGSRSKYAYPNPRSDFSSIPPDTPSEVVFKHVCSRSWFEFWK